MSDILDRLKQYNPPDRTIDSERQIAQDISDAADEIERLIAEVKELREKAEALEWMVSHNTQYPGDTIYRLKMMDDCPPILKLMIEQKDRP